MILRVLHRNFAASFFNLQSNTYTVGQGVPCLDGEYHHVDQNGIQEKYSVQALQEPCMWLRGILPSKYMHVDTDLCTHIPMHLCLHIF